MKLIEQLYINKENICPNCFIGQTGDGIGLYSCQAPYNSKILHPCGLIYNNNEPCTIQDWESCPLNTKFENI